ncbi:MAG: type IVB secretion system protein IcmH/DotU [Burkholderiales bacterium]|jgi:type VI secretion system protein ImpK|nr:type IVB secretion system protein IcmH/DotU [Burkholderiales bacterium]
MANTPSLNTASSQEKKHQRTLLDIFYDGFLMIFLLKNNHPPKNAEEFTQKIKDYFHQTEQEARSVGISDADFSEAKYAFCATIDEVILQSDFAIKDEWELRPLQLTLFGDQLAGNNFFKRLDGLRDEGASRLQAIEIFHMCLLLGFQGKYVFEGSEKRQYFILKLTDEITRMRGHRTGFAPHVNIPDRIIHSLKNDLPLWAIAAAFAFLGVLAYLGINFLLTGDTNSTILASEYQNVINIGPRAAHLTISLP